MKETREAYSTQEKADMLLLELEKLKTEISVIESRYDILKTDYSKICEDAISKIVALKTETTKDPFIVSDTEKDSYGKSKKLEDYNPELYNLEARFMLGLVSAETFMQNTMDSGSGIETPKKTQSLINNIADGIEFGLDKIGDGIILPIEKMINLCNAINHIAHKKTTTKKDI